MKNRYFAALALAGLVSFAACGGDEAETEGTLVEDTAVVAPITPEPVVVDSTGAMPMDSAAMGTMTDTAAAPQ
jgi:hypothetical protein